MTSRWNRPSSAQTLLERGELLSQGLGKLCAKDGEMLLDQRKLRLPTFDIDSGQRLDRVWRNLEPGDIERPLGRKPADRRIDRLGRAVAALEDPFQHARVLSI